MTHIKLQPDIFGTLRIQSCHIQNPGLSKTRAIFKSLSDMQDDDDAYSKPHFPEYLGIFRDTDAYSATLTVAQPEGERGGLPCVF